MVWFFRAYHYPPAKIIDITTNNALKFISLLSKDWKDILRMFAANSFKFPIYTSSIIQFVQKCRSFSIIPLETTLSIGGVRETLTLSSLLCRRVDFITWRPIIYLLQWWVRCVLMLCLQLSNQVATCLFLRNLMWLACLYLALFSVIIILFTQILACVRNFFISNNI